MLEYLAGGAGGARGWINRSGERLDTIDKLTAHRAAAEAAAVADGH